MYFMADCNGRPHNSHKDFQCVIKYRRSEVLFIFFLREIHEIFIQLFTLGNAMKYLN